MAGKPLLFSGGMVRFCLLSGTVLGFTPGAGRVSLFRGRFNGRAGASRRSNGGFSGWVLGRPLLFSGGIVPLGLFSGTVLGFTLGVGWFKGRVSLLRILSNGRVGTSGLL